VVSKRQVYKKSGLQKVRLSKSQFSKRLVSKRTVFKFDILIMLIYGKKPSKIENKPQPSLCLQTLLQQNLRISTNHKYLQNLYGCFLQPDVLKT